MTTQARSSYLVNEILWGHRFEKLITFQKEDGTYKTKYQQQDAEGQVARNLGEVYEAAYQIKQSLRDLLDKIVDKVKGLDYVDAKIVELKPRDRANEKAREEYLTRTPGPPETWLWDILRSSITCKTIKCNTPTTAH